jgi:hypothetical protein
MQAHNPTNLPHPTKSEPILKPDMDSWKFSKPLHWHGKGFTLSWDFSPAWMVLVHFINGESKPWYRRTERPYRFRRWFFRKGRDRFRNLASFRHPYVTLYVFSGFSLLPRKIVIPMDVRILRVREPEAIFLRPAPRPASPVAAIRPMPFASRLPAATVRVPDPGIRHEKIRPPAPGPGLEESFRQFQNNS